MTAKKDGVVPQGAKAKSDAKSDEKLAKDYRSNLRAQLATAAYNSKADSLLRKFSWEQ